MKQKGILKSVLCLLLIVCCTATGFNAGSVQTQAETKDVTNSVSRKYGIRNLAQCFSTLYGAELTYKMKVGQKKKYDFSKESTRRYVLNHCYNELQGELNAGSSVNILSKQIFGKGTSKVNFIIADLGDGEYPELKIKKIYKLSSGRYKVILNIVQFNSDIHTNKYRKTGEANMVIKKKLHSPYGYIVKSMTLKKVSASTINTNTAPNWKAAYKKVLKDPNMDNYTDISYLDMYFGTNCNFNRYFICDVDKNKTPELFLCSTTMPITAVFTYRNGKVVYLGYDSFYGINKSKKLLLVKGHWHGASEHSGVEYTGYKIGKKELKYSFFTDLVVNGVINADTKKAYKKDCNKYVKGCKKFSSFKKYKLSNMKGLKVQ